MGAKVPAYLSRTWDTRTDMAQLCRRQGLIEAPIEALWELVGDPNRHPEWWPRMVDTDCANLGVGCQYRGVVRGPLGRREEHNLVLERFEGCREIKIRCAEVGAWNRWVLTEARGGTFVEGEFGVEPQTVASKAFGVFGGRLYLRRWLDASFESLRATAERETRGAPA